jgi:hypothetical protein
LQQVDDEVDDDDDDGGGQHQPHHLWDVALAGGADGDLAQAGDGEDILDDHRAAEQADELQAQDGQGRAGRVAQHVLADHPGLRQAAAAQRPDVILAQRVDHRAADLRGHAGDAAQGQGDHRQRDRGQPRAGRGGKSGVTGWLEPVQVDREPGDQPDRDQEAGDREAQHGQDLHHAVRPPAPGGGHDAEQDRHHRADYDRADDQRQRHR